jgi:hypothetical protein
MKNAAIHPMKNAAIHPMKNASAGAEDDGSSALHVFHRV